MAQALIHLGGTTRQGSTASRWRRPALRRRQTGPASACFARATKSPGERTNHVVAATLCCDALHLSAHPVRRSEDDALMLDRRLPREQAVDAVVVVLVPQLRN